MCALRHTPCQPAARQGSENIRQRKPPDLAPQNNLASPVEADEMKNVLADVDAYDGDARLVRFIVRGLAPGSSRSIPH
jgi:hypothetical protein